MYTDAGVSSTQGRFPGDATPQGSRDSRRATLADNFSILICVADSISSSLFLRAIGERGGEERSFSVAVPWRIVLCESE